MRVFSILHARFHFRVHEEKFSSKHLFFSKRQGQFWLGHENAERLKVHSERDLRQQRHKLDNWHLAWRWDLLFFQVYKTRSGLPFTLCLGKTQQNCSMMTNKSRKETVHVHHDHTLFIQMNSRKIVIKILSSRTLCSGLQAKWMKLTQTCYVWGPAFCVSFSLWELGNNVPGMNMGGKSVPGSAKTIKLYDKCTRVQSTCSSEFWTVKLEGRPPAWNFTDKIIVQLWFWKHSTSFSSS